MKDVKRNKKYKKKYTFRELSEAGISIDELPDDTVIILDDRCRKYDEKNDRFVRPGEPGYDDLPEMIF